MSRTPSLKITWPWRLLGIYLALGIAATAWLLLAVDPGDRYEAIAVYSALFSIPWSLLFSSLFSGWTLVYTGIAGFFINVGILFALGWFVRRRPA